LPHPFLSWCVWGEKCRDPHTVVRKGLRTFLSFDSELEVVGEAADGAQALRLARELTPDVVLMDLLMPGMDGIAATAAIRRALPETEVLALTSASRPSGWSMECQWAWEGTWCCLPSLFSFPHSSRLARLET
jgi:hypothetical protein